MQVEEARLEASFEWSVESVLRVITATVGRLRWSDHLRRFPNLRRRPAHAPLSGPSSPPPPWRLPPAPARVPGLAARCACVEG